MGCLKNIFKAIILVLAAIGFVSIGGKDYVINLWNQYTNPPQDVMLERAKKVGDFSQVPDEYEIDKAASVLGYNGVLAEHRATGQKMVVVDSGKKPLLTPQDFEDGSADKKLEDLTKKLKYQFINIQDLKITKHGKINSFGQKTNFIKFQAKANKLPIGEIEGIISAVETEDGKIKIIASANEKGKYSQIVSEEFFKKVKE
ncbi:MAG TPA: hypothetical protein PKI94_01055 [Candidatus Gastranaerophilaceae bacterium]|nr:hypothetical protein [Candidatus Gastranaerophilaceae bacterium]